MKTIFVFLINGFEETEALATVDILRRASLNVETVSLTGELTVTGSHNITVFADTLFEDVDFGKAQMLVIPGGTTRFSEHEGFKKEIKSFYESGGEVAAICAAPMVLGILGILKGRKATCYPGFEKYLEGATLQTDKPVIVDGNIITAKGPGLAIDFALTIIEILDGKSKRDQIATQLQLM